MEGFRLALKGKALSLFQTLVVYTYADFEDLEKDMKAGFAGYVDQEGNLIVRLVIAGYPARDRQSGDQSAPSLEVPRGDRSKSPEA